MKFDWIGISLGIAGIFGLVMHKRLSFEDLKRDLKKSGTWMESGNATNLQMGFKTHLSEKWKGLGTAFES